MQTCLLVSFRNWMHEDASSNWHLYTLLSLFSLSTVKSGVFRSHWYNGLENLNIVLKCAKGNKQLSLTAFTSGLF